MPAPAQASAILAFGPFLLDVHSRRLTAAGRPVAIGDRALDLLIALTARPGELIGKDELTARVWPNLRVEDSNLRVQIAALRHALGDGSGGEAYLATDQGRGYRFVAPVDHVTAHGAPIQRQSLPPRLTNTIGRDADIASIAGRIGASRLLTICGPGGIGKTTVALACATETQSQYADGVVFADMSTGVDPAIAVAASLGLRLAEGDVPALIEHLSALHILVVLDGCEAAVERSAALAEAAVCASPNVFVLATSREPLRIYGEIVWRLGPLATPAPDQALSAAEALSFPAVRLFVERARALDDRFQLSDDAARRIANLCRRVDGLPLAIELAASRVGAFGLDGVEAGLDNRFALLSLGRRTAPPRHRTLAATMDWSYDALSADEQQALRCFSLFQGPFDAAAAASIVFGDRTGADQIHASLFGLVSKSLVTVDPSRDPVEYRLLDTTRDYARLKLEAAGEAPLTSARHAAWIMTVLGGAGAQLAALPMREWLRYFSLKIEDAETALDWAFSADGDPDLAVRLTLSAVPIWIWLARSEECRRWVEMALTVVEPDSPGEMALHVTLGWTLENLTPDMTIIEPHYSRANAIAKQLGDANGELRSEFGMWNIHIATASVAKARAAVARFDALARRVGDAFEMVIADRMTAVTELLAGELQSARAAVERVRRASRTWSSKERLAWHAYDPDIMTRNTLVTLLWLDGQADTAITVAQANAARALAAGNHNTTVAVLTDTACGVAIQVGDLEAAERYLDMIGASVRRGAPDGFADWTAIARAVLAARAGDAAPGLTLLTDGLPPEVRHPRFAGIVTDLALSLGMAGETAAARVLADQLLHRVERNGELWIWSEVQRVRGELCDDDEVAIRLFRAAFERARAQGARIWALRAAASLGRRSPETVAERLEPLLAEFTEGLWTRDLVEARSVLKQHGG